MGGQDGHGDFDHRLRAARDRQTGRQTGVKSEARQTAMGQAFRLSTELVSGVLVGGGIGWVLDGWLGTGPWLLIAFFFLGIAAGMLNAMRAAREMNAQAEADTDAGVSARGGENEGGNGAAR